MMKGNSWIRKREKIRGANMITKHFIGWYWKKEPNIKDCGCPWVLNSPDAGIIHVSHLLSCITDEDPHLLVQVKSMICFTFCCNTQNHTINRSHSMSRYWHVTHRSSTYVFWYENKTRVSINMSLHMSLIDLTTTVGTACCRCTSQMELLQLPRYICICIYSLEFLCWWHQNEK